MKFRFFSLALAAVLLFSGINFASAATRKPKSKPLETHATVIASVTPQSITINEDKLTKTFAITQFTEITLNGQRASVNDLKPGMSVTVALGGDPSKASRIDAGGAPVQPAAPGKSR
jgi:hypothetical protein